MYWLKTQLFCRFHDAAAAAAAADDDDDDDGGDADTGESSE